MIDLTGRKALVIGAASGIGEASARTLAAAGAHVVIADLNGEAAQVVAREIGGEAWQVDLSDTEALATLSLDVDILVNNAGIDDAMSFDELDIARWRRINAVNLEAPFLLAKAFVPIMRRNQFGRIVNIASGSVANPMTGFVAYRAAKMGVIGLTRALSTELGRDGITVNAVSPGVITTPMSAASLTTEFLDATVAKQGVKRAGEPEDIAGAVAFLASREAAFITGQTVMVNGGAAFT